MAAKDDVAALTRLVQANHDAVMRRLDALERRRSSWPAVLLALAFALVVAVLVRDPRALQSVRPLHELYAAVAGPSAPCPPLSVYRYGTVRIYAGPVLPDCSVRHVSVVEAANALFPSPDQNITRLLSMEGTHTPDHGRDLPDPLPLTAGRTVIALSAPQREHFMWPSVRVGHTVEVELGEEKQKVTVKTLANEPRVFELNNLLTSEECDHFYEIATQVQSKMDESMVGADHKTSTKSKARSSRHTWIGSVFADGTGPWVTDEVVERVERRIFDLTRLGKDTAEPFQVVFYNMSDFYYGHHDFTDPQYAPSNPYFKGGGNRYVTVLLYLNDVSEGGHTAFPFASATGEPQNRNIDPVTLYEGSGACDLDGLRVHPRKGGAAMFYNLLENGHMDGKFDKWTVHAGCKPTKGPKYISNKWIRNKRVDGHLYDDVW